MEPGHPFSEVPPENDLPITDVWVIEDDIGYQRLVVNMLEKIPEITCSFVSTRCEPALERLKSGKNPDVILMDISLQ